MTAVDSIITKGEILDILKDRVKAKDPVRGRHIGLPRDIDFSIKNSILKVYINEPAQNMQTNSAAFEAWIIAVKAWLSDLIKFVEFDFSLPQSLQIGEYGTPPACHYNRFLYRVNNCSNLFSEWFILSKEKENTVAKFMDWLKKGPCLLNHSLRERESVIDTDKMERQIESWFAFEGGKTPLCDLWDLNPTKVFNQLPVGVFFEEIASKNAVFTRGASAIDLWGIGNDKTTLHIIELKCGGNINMGVISEMLFYTFIIYDTCIAQNNLFKFGRYRNSPETTDMKVIQNWCQGSKKHLYTHILSEYYHPLFSKGVFDLLVEGFSKLQIKLNRASYNYNEKKLIGISG